MGFIAVTTDFVAASASETSPPTRYLSATFVSTPGRNLSSVNIARRGSQQRATCQNIEHFTLVVFHIHVTDARESFRLWTTLKKHSLKCEGASDDSKEETVTAAKHLEQVGMVTSHLHQGGPESLLDILS